MTVEQIAMYFLIYSFLGWTVEVIYQALTKGLVVNRGFLNGPVCPIYGFGVVGLFLLLNSVTSENPREMSFWKVFLAGMVLATLIELIGGWVLDRCFHARWWDYSGNPYNFHGYICLEFSIIWGFAIVLVVRDIHPFIRTVFGHILSHGYAIPLMIILYIAYFADFAVSVFIMIGLNKRFAELDELRDRMRVVSDELSTRIGTNALETAQKMDEAKLQGSLAKAELRDAVDDGLKELDQTVDERVQELKEELEEWRSEMERRKEEFYQSYRKRRHFGFGRVLRAFPQLRFHEHDVLVKELKDYIHKD